MFGIIFWFTIGYCACKYNWPKRIAEFVEEITSKDD